MMSMSTRIRIGVIIAAFAVGGICRSGDVGTDATRQLLISWAQQRGRDQRAEMDGATKEYQTAEKALRDDIRQAKRHSASLDPARREPAKGDLRTLEAKLDATKASCQQRYLAAKAALKTAEAVEAIAQEADIETIDAQLAAALPPIEWKGGEIGTLQDVYVAQRLNKSSVLARVPRGEYGSRLFVARGWDISQWVTGQHVDLGVCRITGTHAVGAFAWGGSAVYVVEPLRVRPADNPAAPDGP